MIIKQNAALDQVVIHQIGKKSENEDVTFSDSILNIDDNEELKDLLINYFTDSFREPDFYTFTFNDGDFVLNPMYNYLGNVFDDPDTLYEMSVKIARLLYDKSSNPLIKAGDLCMGYIRDLFIDDEIVDAICILKSENKDDFLQITKSGRKFGMEIQRGINLQKIDKICLVLNTDRDTGFKILNIDHSNKNVEARYWRDEFLILDKASDDYQSTIHMIKMTAEFVKKRLPADTPISKAEQADFLNKSEKYFKNNEKFDQEDYSEKVFDQPILKQAFLEFAEESTFKRPINEDFAISELAVKKQSRVFKSVIKLDKNFHIYVHGDSSKIVKGELDNGQKYYMLYYDKEE